MSFYQIHQARYLLTGKRNYGAPLFAYLRPEAVRVLDRWMAAQSNTKWAATATTAELLSGGNYQDV